MTYSQIDTVLTAAARSEIEWSHGLAYPKTFLPSWRQEDTTRSAAPRPSGRHLCEWRRSDAQGRKRDVSYDSPCNTFAVYT